MQEAGKPLTVEQLRKMVNTPVYVEDKRYPKRSAWGMVHDGFCDMQIDAYFFADYGERWVAYPCTFAHIDREKWEPCMWCALNGQFGLNNHCSACGRPLTDEAWAELERRVFGG